MTLPANATRLPHTVSDQPFDPDAIYKYTDAQKALFEASQLRLMWWKFRRHKPALISGIFLGVLYLSILISEFLAPYNLETRNSSHIYAPPQSHPSVPQWRVPRRRSCMASTSSSTWRI